MTFVTHLTAVNTEAVQTGVMGAPPCRFSGVKVFSATMADDRAHLGEKITAWLEANPVQVVDQIVLQSSGDAFHCLSILLFYEDD
jgi:hypothetical protein